MYGIVNKAIEELVKENYGEEKWELIKARSAVDVDFFISNEPYDDAITYQLAAAVADEMKIPLSDVLIMFGEHWVLKTGKEKYGSLMEAGGNNLKEFLCNLPLFHNRIMLMYPRLTPPEFKITDIEASSVCVHYHSKRQGLKEFVCGLLQGLAKMYNTTVVIELLQNRDEGASHEIYKVSW
ncbi:heme-NO-binding protein [Lacibacter cauensis]|uniref:Heme-NO-binding protein n=1 Tax=Lacibacter cauensis TaxID=510947 RepID=A0A562SIM2_9BACT|nr:heme NO-binding domain-containing protein [Lacibacter cauensis]TWI81121.1 heme-NO-binding protein [Lacibacter cauensis]